MRYLVVVSVMVAAGASVRADYRSPYSAASSHYEVRGVSSYVYSIEPSFAQSWEGWRRARIPYGERMRENRYRDSLARSWWYDSLSARPWYRPNLHGPRYDYYGQYGGYGVYNNIPQSTLGRPQLDRFPRSTVYPHLDSARFGPQRPRFGVYGGARRGR